MIVDDEDMVITSVRAFLSLETEYTIHGFTDPEAAAKFVETHPIDVIVSDYLMPKMNGIQLLTSNPRFRRSTKSVSFSISRSRGTTRNCCS
jgi:DNA-binding NarL/FixJ family response regulator